MPSYEWALTTPVTKEFLVNGQELLVAADTVRLLSTYNESSQALFFVRFIYGTTANGGFEPSVRDDGLVIGGPSYHDLMASSTDLSSEQEVLQLCATLCGWNGSMRAY